MMLLIGRRTSARRRASRRFGRREGFWDALRAVYEGSPSFFWMALLFLAGVAVGTLSIRWLGGSAEEEMAAILTLFLQKRGSQTLGSTFLSALGGNALLLILLFLAGYCTIAWPLVLLAPLFKGMGFGLIAGLLLSQEGFSACGQIALLLPGTVLSALALLSACDWSMRQSRELLRTVRPDLPPAAGYRRSPGPDAGRYLLHFLLLLAVLAAAALLEGALFFWFSR